VRAAASLYRGMGAEVEEISIPLHLAAPAIWSAIAHEGGTVQMLHGNGFGFNWKGLYVPSLMQAHDAALPQVDRGHHDHAALRLATPATKFATSRCPTAWLFSGWNCRPSTGPRPTIAAKSCP